MTALVISEHNNNELKPVTLNTVTAAKALDDLTGEVVVFSSKKINK